MRTDIKECPFRQKKASSVYVRTENEQTMEYLVMDWPLSKAITTLSMARTFVQNNCWEIATKYRLIDWTLSPTIHIAEVVDCSKRCKAPCFFQNENALSLPPSEACRVLKNKGILRRPWGRPRCGSMHKQQRKIDAFSDHQLHSRGQ